MAAPETEKSNTPENEIRVSDKTNIINGVERVEEAFKKFDKVTLSGINNDISKVFLIIGIVKLKILGLHQYNFIETIKTEKKEEANENKSEDNQKYSTRFKVELHKNKLSSPPKGSYYEAPYSEDEVKKILSVKPQERLGKPLTSRGGRGGFFRGGRGGGRGEGRGRGGGRGMGGRGRGGFFRGEIGRWVIKNEFDQQNGKLETQRIMRIPDNYAKIKGGDRGIGGRGRGESRGRGENRGRGNNRPRTTRGEIRGRGGRGYARGRKNNEEKPRKFVFGKDHTRFVKK